MTLGPGADDEFDPWDLADVRARVVLPVVTCLIRPEDLQEADVGWGPRQRAGWGWARNHEDELWVLVTARHQSWQSQIWMLETAEQTPTLGDVAWEFGNRLEDWVCESVYWGERPHLDFSIPLRHA